MQPSTIFLGRLIGLTTLLFSISMSLHRRAIVETASILIRDRPLLLIFGLIALICGVAMVLSHNIWSGGAAPIIVTLVGWIILFRGLALLFLPPDSLVAVFEWFRFDQLFFLYAGMMFALGLYLTYKTFTYKTFAARRP